MYTTISIIISINVAVLAIVIWRASRTISDRLSFISGRLSSDLAELGKKLNDANKELSAIGDHLDVIARTLDEKEENASGKPIPLTPLQVNALAYIGSTCDELNRQGGIDLAYMTEKYIVQAIKRDDQNELEDVLRQCIALYVVAITKLILENPDKDLLEDLSEEQKERRQEDINYLSDLYDGIKQLEASMENVYAESWYQDVYRQEIRRLQKAGLIKPIETSAGDVLIDIVQAELDWHIGEGNKKNDAS